MDIPGNSFPYVQLVFGVLVELLVLPGIRIVIPYDCRRQKERNINAWDRRKPFKPLTNIVQLERPGNQHSLLPVDSVGSNAQGCNQNEEMIIKTRWGSLKLWLTNDHCPDSQHHIRDLNHTPPELLGH